MWVEIKFDRGPGMIAPQDLVKQIVHKIQRLWTAPQPRSKNWDDVLEYGLDDTREDIFGAIDVQIGRYGPSKWLSIVLQQLSPVPTKTAYLEFKINTRQGRSARAKRALAISNMLLPVMVEIYDARKSSKVLPDGELVGDDVAVGTTRFT